MEAVPAGEAAETCQNQDSCCELVRAAGAALALKVGKHLAHGQRKQSQLCGQGQLCMSDGKCAQLSLRLAIISTMQVSPVPAGL